jgi:hypothetical protein
MRKSMLIAFLIAFMITGLAFVGSVHFGAAQSGTSFSGIISSDAIWTKASNPYTLTGPVAVNTGITLTIEPGVTVNLATYYIQVNGTLVAKGTSTDKIYFNGGSSSPNWAITFTPKSTSWNKQTGSGSIIENAVIDTPSTGVSIDNVTPKIDSNSITGFYAVEVWDGSPVISNNVINGEVGVHNNGSPTITGNTITGTIAAFGTGTTVISKNTILGSGDETGISCLNAIISDNIIVGFQEGVSTSDGVSTIEGNLIINNAIGIQIGAPNVDYTYAQMPPSPLNFQVTIQNNLITNNSKGISVTDLPLNVQNANFKATIDNNNIQNNLNYNFYLAATPISITAANNWWGTTDTQAINQTIYDFKNDFNVGNVTFVPFLTAPNPQTPNPNVTIPTPVPTSQSPSPTTTSTSTPTSSTSPSISPSQTEAKTTSSLPTDLIATGVVAIVIVAVAIGAFLLGKRAERKSTRVVDYQI